MDNELNLTYIYDELVSRGYNVSLHDVEKLNGTHHDAISIIPEHGGIAPTIYEETVIEMVASGMSAQEIADEVISFFLMHGGTEPRLPAFHPCRNVESMGFSACPSKINVEENEQKKTPRGGVFPPLKVMYSCGASVLRLGHE